ncbi:hypothetical protein K435DRAFT_475150 [Dendrothele bispora CBS 962.96]|uniref:Uncharacterized protein n=1 Tax=Dendrothele bispora (strain CBS 962.96) TaxID=1314807 RepID=A0A4S8KZ78_DENBC|nr:hypothetical protein K435DRAFT_475150 [Dendrothele bispora CBS 962.96]
MQPSSPPHKIKRKPAPKVDVSERYPPPDPSDPFLPLSDLRDRSKTCTTFQLYPAQPPKPSHYRPRTHSSSFSSVQLYSDGNATQSLLSDAGEGEQDDNRSILATATDSVRKNAHKRSSMNTYTVVTGEGLGSTFDSDGLRLPMGFDFDRCHSIHPDPLPPPSPETRTSPLLPHVHSAALEMRPDSRNSASGRFTKLFGLKEPTKKRSKNSLMDVSPTSPSEPFSPFIMVSSETREIESRLSSLGESNSQVRSPHRKAVSGAVGHGKSATTIKRTRRISSSSLTSSLYLSAPSSPIRSDYETSTIASVGSTGSVTVTSHRMQSSFSPAMSHRLSRDGNSSSSGSGDVSTPRRGGEHRRKKSRSSKEKSVNVQVRRGGREVQSETESVPRNWRRQFDLEESDMDCESDYVSTGNVLSSRSSGKNAKLVVVPSLDTSGAISRSRSLNYFQNHSHSPSSSSSSSSRPTSCSTTTSISASSYISTPTTTPRSSISRSHFCPGSSTSTSNQRHTSTSSTSTIPLAIIVTPHSPIKPETNLDVQTEKTLSSSSPSPSSSSNSKQKSPRKSHFPTLSPPSSPRHSPRSLTQNLPSSAAGPPPSPSSRSPTRVFSDSVVPTFAAFLSRESLVSENGVGSSTIQQQMDGDEKKKKKKDWSRENSKQRELSTVHASTNKSFGTSTNGLGSGLGVGVGVDDDCHNDKENGGKQQQPQPLQEQRKSGSKFTWGVRKILRALKREKEYHDNGREKRVSSAPSTLGKIGSAVNLSEGSGVGKNGTHDDVQVISLNKYNDDDVYSSVPPSPSHTIGTFVRNNSLRKSSVASFMSSSSSGAVDLHARQYNNSRESGVLEESMDVVVAATAAEIGRPSEKGEIDEMNMTGVQMTGRAVSVDDGSSNDVDVDMVMMVSTGEDESRRCSPPRRPMSTIESEGEFDFEQQEEDLDERKDELGEKEEEESPDVSQPVSVSVDASPISISVSTSKADVQDVDDAELDARLFHRRYRQASRSPRTDSDPEQHVEAVDGPVVELGHA